MTLHGLLPPELPTRGGSHVGRYLNRFSRNGIVYVTGQSWGGAAKADDYATVAYDAATGAQLWARRYNGPGIFTDHPASAVVGPNGKTVFVTGISAGRAASGDDYATMACRS